MVPPKNPKAAPKARVGLNPRSRSGCVTCKAKHLKCDETRPACQQCSRKGINCGGYAQGLRWSFKHQPALQNLSFEDYNPTSSSPRRSEASVTENRNHTKGKGPSTSDNRRPRHRNSISSSSSSGTAFTTRSDEECQEDTESLLLGPLARDFDVTKLPARSSTSRPSINTLIKSPPASFTAVAETSRPNLPLTNSLVDTSSAFIINWFEQVCPAWSGFDSNTNMNRKIAIDLWRTSTTVCSSLESMSAAFLASRLPSMRQSALRLMGRATDFIQAELEVVKAQPDLHTIPTSLLFSLFCLGTTVCWVDARGFGLPFLREARSLIQRLNAQSVMLNVAGLDMLTFFNKSLTYCEMLLAVVRDDEPLDHQENEDTASNQLQLIEERAPHPWTGVSTVTTRLFAECIRLCRSFRHRMRQGMDPQRYFSYALQDLIVAQRLEEQLLELEFPPDNPDVDTGDFATPVSHLARVAEAYRLSSLLHLYQTFPDLVSLRLPTESPMTDSGSVPWDEWIIPLALRLVKVLEHIPTTSGTRVIQPLLYISASTGLRHDNSASSDMISLFGTLQQDLMGGTGPSIISPPPLFDSHNLSLYISQMASAPVPEEPMSNLSLEVSSARHFVMRRLSILESSLPPAPVVVAKDLVQSIWRAYDSEVGTPTVHWIDIMEDNNLRSLFG
ncbi:C6 zinc finger domain containing protein [Colletotrichum truncatum]|uniref:C6 zinc finger domain containing protein n=1 Tax=Colletotrichum truncatum TaxID=5467 RepID=A0ACC3ZHG6_COLTU|nr:C6 zinc finger domain containing protein [Colletotrichum truncatum]KAF6782305.1 C6 zinc finger domain containing protein [Colletotrichum truncatum]